MSNNPEDAYAALMTDFVVGSAGEACALLVETHVAMNAKARAAARALEAVGGLLLEQIEAIETGPLGGVPDRMPETLEPHGLRGARAIVETATTHPEALRWRWKAPALRELRLPIEGVSLIRLAQGARVLEHDHEGDEWTLVLRGAFSDVRGVYSPGDLGYAEAGFDHAPRVEGSSDCICLSVSDGRWRFRNPIANLAARLLS